MGLRNTLKQAVLEYLFKQTGMPATPSDGYISLHTADPGGTGASELAGGAYARAHFAPDPNNTTNTNFNAFTTVGSADETTNKADVVFPQATADWNGAAPIKFWGYWSAASGGTFYAGGALNGSNGVIVLNGNTLRFMGGSPGQFKFDVS